MEPNQTDASHFGALLPRELGDGLVLRQPREDEREAVIEFNREFLGEDSGLEVGYILRQPHPAVGLDDFLLVVTAEGQIASSLCLGELALRVGLTSFKIAQPEFVATRPQFRGRGLVRAQFAVLHEWMARRGLALAMIGGISYYYRQFGYEYGIDLPRLGALTPELHADLIVPPPGIRVRRAMPGDSPALARLLTEQAAQVDVSNPLRLEDLEWSVGVRTFENNDIEDWIALFEDEAVGSARIWYKDSVGTMFGLTGSLAAGQALIGVMLAQPGLLRLNIDGQAESDLGRWVAGLEPLPRAGYAQYVRVNDPRQAFELFRTEFERRLATSAFARLSRELDLGFYRFGVQLVFQQGRLTAVNSLPGEQSPKIGLPPDLLPRLLFGFRSVDTFKEVYPDFSASAEDLELLRVLFPRLRAFLRFFI